MFIKEEFYHYLCLKPVRIAKITAIFHKNQPIRPTSLPDGR